MSASVNLFKAAMDLTHAERLEAYCHTSGRILERWFKDALDGDDDITVLVNDFKGFAQKFFENNPSFKITCPTSIVNLIPQCDFRKTAEKALLLSNVDIVDYTSETGQPSVEQPKTDQSKADQSTVDQSKTEQPQYLLVLKGTSTTNESLAKIPIPHSVDLSFTHITDDGLQYLSHCTKINLANTKVNGSGFKHLRNVKELDITYLTGCLLHLKQLHHLRKVSSLYPIDNEFLPKGCINEARFARPQWSRSTLVDAMNEPIKPTKTTRQQSVTFTIEQCTHHRETSSHEDGYTTKVKKWFDDGSIDISQYAALIVDF